jgi:hypothetical protein
MTKKKTKSKAKKGNRLPEELKGLIEAARIEIENEYLDDLRDDPDELIETGEFSMYIQSIFSGTIDTPAAALPLLETIAPYIEGRALVGRLAAELKKPGATATSLANELVDAAAVSAIDVFGTALAALASGKPEKVPAAAKPLLPHLEKEAKVIAAALEE